MKLAVIGTGKTGGEVVKLLGPERISDTFDIDKRPTVEKLRQADAVVIFVPGSAVDEIIEVVLESGTPAVWGSTGYEWAADLDQRLKEASLKWIRASNFSLGMNVVRRAIRAISEGAEILNNPEYRIHEVHHIHKKDAPSGTALSWREWLGKNAGITSERKGDIKGIHELTVSTPSESISLKHEAHDRAVFAEGAIWAAEQLVIGEVSAGFHDFSSIFDKAIATELENR